MDCQKNGGAVTRGPTDLGAARVPARRLDRNCRMQTE